MAKFTKKITNLLNQQVPEFVLSDHPKFLEFVSSLKYLPTSIFEFCGKLNCPILNKLSPLVGSIEHHSLVFLSGHLCILFPLFYHFAKLKCAS